MQSEYRIVRIDPKIYSDVIKTKVFNRDGSAAGTEEKPVKYQVAYAQERFGNSGAEYVFRTKPGFMDVGDIISGWDDCGQLRDVYVVEGKNAIAKPALPTPPPAPQQEPEVTTPQMEPWRFAVASGYAATPADYAAFAKAFFSLEARYNRLAVAFEQHVKTCEGSLV